MKNNPPSSLKLFNQIKEKNTLIIRHLTKMSTLTINEHRAINVCMSQIMMCARLKEDSCLIELNKEHLVDLIAMKNTLFFVAFARSSLMDAVDDTINIIVGYLNTDASTLTWSQKTDAILSYCEKGQNLFLEGMANGLDLFYDRLLDLD